MHPHLRYLFILLFLSVGLQAQVKLSDDARVSVLTCGVGNEVYSLFGHTAIRVKDSATALDVVFNYGAFDFEAPNFVGRFTKGDLQYFVTADSFSDFMYQYYFERRSVSEQELLIEPDARRKIFERLMTVMNSDERFYTYKFIDRNCTNMAADLLRDELGIPLEKQGNLSQPYRKVLFPYFDRHFYEQIGTSLIFGTKVDEPAQKLFLPVELEQSIATETLDGKALSAPKKILLDFPVAPNPGSWWNNIWSFIAILAFFAFVKSRYVTAAYLLITGIIGAFFSIAGWYSLHEELAWNYNALLLNPAFLILAFAVLLRKRLLMGRLVLFCAACMALYLVVIFGKVYFWIAMPIVAANAIILYRIWQQSKHVVLLASNDSLPPVE